MTLATQRRPATSVCHPRRLCGRERATRDGCTCWMLVEVFLQWPMTANTPIWCFSDRVLAFCCEAQAELGCFLTPLVCTCCEWLPTESTSKYTPRGDLVRAGPREPRVPPVGTAGTRATRRRRLRAAKSHSRLASRGECLFASEARGDDMQDLERRTWLCRRLCCSNGHHRLQGTPHRVCAALPAPCAAVGAVLFVDRLSFVCGRWPPYPRGRSVRRLAGLAPPGMSYRRCVLARARLR